MTAVRGGRAWTRESVAESEWRVALNAVALREIERIVETLRSERLVPVMSDPEEFAIPALRAAMQDVTERLDDGIGMAVVQGLPVDAMSEAEARAVFTLIGSLIAPLVATRYDGTLLYDVTDTERPFGGTVRGSATNAELSFHTDNAFGIAIPDYVGLLCLRPALAGGASRVCCVATVHDAMLRSDPQLLRRLYEPAYFDRQGQHAPHAAKVLSAPLFRYDGQRLDVRLTPNLIRRGYAMAGVPLDDALAEGLEKLEGLLSDERHWFEFSLKRGEMQFLDNRRCAHYRSAFVDADDPTGKRLLVRAWYRVHGGPGYDG